MSRQLSRNRQPPGNGEQGFTLVEMMIALLIFGILASGAVLLLRFSVDAEAASRERIDEMAELRRFSAIWNADMAQAIPRTHRGVDGNLNPAFAVGATTGNGALLRLVRGGWTNYDGTARPSLQKVEYRLVDGQLERVGYAMLDGAEPEESSPVLSNVQSLSLRFRLPEGNWTDAWQPQRAAELPIAIEMNVERTGNAPLRLLALIGADNE